MLNKKNENTKDISAHKISPDSADVFFNLLKPALIAVLRNLNKIFFIVSFQ